MSTVHSSSVSDSSTSTAHSGNFSFDDGSSETSVSVTDLSSSSLTNYFSCEVPLENLSTETARSFNAEEFAAFDKNKFEPTPASSNESLNTARSLHDPPSFYHLPELNKVDYKPRLIHVPSHYAFSELANYNVMDAPDQLYKLQSQVDLARYAASSTSVKTFIDDNDSKSVYFKKDIQP